MLATLIGASITAAIALAGIGWLAARKKARALAEGSAAGSTRASEPTTPSPASAPSAPAPAATAPAAVAVKERPASILDYISEDTIVLDTTATARDDVIRELVALGVATGQVADEGVVLDSALAREALMSTAVGQGIAIPHAKSDGAASPMVAFTRVNDVDWKSPSGDLAKLVFLISVPAADAGDEHLRILANLARALSKPNVREALLEATTKAQVLDELKAAVG